MSLPGFLSSLLLLLLPGADHGAIRTDPAIALARRFYDAGLYDAAITEYRRFIFFNPGSDSLSRIYSRISLCFRSRSDWAAAARALDRAVDLAGNDSLKGEWRLQSAVLDLASGNHSGAELSLLKLVAFAHDSVVRQKAFFLRGINAVYRHRWAEAREAFGRYYELAPDTAAEQALTSLLAESERLGHRSPRTARRLSLVLPGAGQAYAGDWANAANAFLLTGALGSWIIYELVNANYGNALTVYFFLFRRYHVGGVYNAGRIAQERNERVANEFAELIMDFCTGD